MKASRLLTTAICLITLGCSEAADKAATSAAKRQPVLEAAPAEFLIRGHILEETDISTISRGEDGLGLIASDEGAVVQLISFSRDGTGADILKNLPLTTPENVEIDMEASTYMNGWYYVTGSHGVAKKKGVYQASRAKLYRFKLKGEALASEVESASLEALFASDPILGPHFRKPLQRKGLNIEGLSGRNNHLYFGLRSPNKDGDAFVLRISGDALFAADAAALPPYEVLRIPLEKGLGIRGMTAFRDGFFILAGNAGSESSKHQPVTEDYIEGRPTHLVFWKPGPNEVTTYGALPQRGKGKEEAILVLDEKGPSTVRILILYDSIRGGGATIFEVATPE